MKSRSNYCAEFDDPMLAMKYESNHSEPRLPARETHRIFSELLDSKPSEQEVQNFFEQFPHCLPGSGLYHHGIREDIVISKLPLMNDFVTDFAYMSENSQQICIFCVEIERPDKAVFRKDNHFTSDFLQARQQIIDWNYWGQTNIRSVPKYFGRLGRFISNGLSYVSMRCILIAGRRSELTNRSRKERWSAEAALLPQSVQIMTYDRLLEKLNHSYDQADNKKILVCSYQNRSLKVKNIG